MLVGSVFSLVILILWMILWLLKIGTSLCALKVKAAFKRYVKKLSDIDELIQARNRDKSLKNRCGVAQLPFQLLRPTSAPGVTARGVPNSITV